MCRMYALRASHATNAACALLAAPRGLAAQSRADHLGQPHPDGWGLAVRGGPAGELLVHGLPPAGDDPAFAAAARAACGTTVLGHVRKASVGDKIEANLHPFALDGWLLAHNGTLVPFARLEAELAAEVAPPILARRRGTTDSELVLLMLASRVQAAGLDWRRLDAPAPLAEIVSDLVRDLLLRCRRCDPADESALNLILTDGRLLVATCFNRTLWWRQDDGSQPCETCGRLHYRPDSHPYRAVQVASEPTGGGPWQPLAAGDLLTVDAELRAALRRIDGLPPAGQPR